jgi:hypothetical protein
MTSDKKFGAPDGAQEAFESDHARDSSPAYAAAQHGSPIGFEEIPWICLGVAIALTLVLGLSVHVFMTEYLGIPYPSAPVDAPIAQYISRGALHALGVIYLNFLIRPTLTRRSWLTRWAVVFAITTALTETLRATFMNGYCTNAMSLALLTSFPNCLDEFILVGLIIACEHFMTSPIRKLITAACLGAISYFLIRPEMQQLSEYLSATFSYMQNAEWCKEPYGWDVKIPAYLTFIEPTLGAFAAVSLGWDQLPRKYPLKIVAFTMMILMVKRELLSAPIYMMWSGMPPMTGLASVGQFSLEFIALGVLTSCSWIWIIREKNSKVVPGRIKM